MNCNFDDDVSLVITSCRRHDLLSKTLQSFVENNTYKIKQIIIVEDSSIEIDRGVLTDILNSSITINYTSCELVCLSNGENLGQMKSIDIAYEKVTSPFIFHCEDDWMFHRSGFIEESLRILKQDKKIFTVWLRGYNDLCGHSISKPIELDNGLTYHEIIPMGLWSGFTLNPGLRRKQDCLLLSPYALQKHVDVKLKNRNTVTESDLSILYGNLGFKAAVTSEVRGFVHHIGDGYHIANVWESVIIVKIKNLIKRMLK
ncbi:glycosyltransferase family 2 protein [Kangiella sp.]|uniref:glycosyltransferase family 2 protein n=1 Tax=Kangiella sp. TaxID=1920245 RepID=UPI003A8DBF35